MPSQFLFYGGKGGVGKTTCAAAHAVAAARAGSRVLVVSVDPAHSLGDALGVRLSARVTRMDVGAAPGTRGRRRQLLHAVELDAARAFRRWLGRHRRALGDIVEHGTWLDRDDVDELMGLSLPGIDELAGILEIVRLASSRYDLIVVDTAPTGHALRLLAAPETVGTVAEILEALQQEHRLIREQFARVRRPEHADRLIALLAGQADDTRALLRDPARSALRWILLPEELSVAETRDALRALDEWGIPVRSLVVNRVTPDGPPCRTCDGRRAEERRVLARIARLAARRTFSNPAGSVNTLSGVHTLPAHVGEPRGLAALTRLSRHLMTASPLARSRSVRRAKTDGSRPGPSTRRFAVDLPRGASLLFLGGKGGVGKTTAAAVVALQLARSAPMKRVLLLSTDPAHSLGDVLRHLVVDEPQPIPGGPSNLDVRELDATHAFLARRADLDAALEDIGLATGASALANRGATRGLMDLAPPGIDELFGLLSILRAGPASYDQIVVDTAPTGHALRLLEMPEVAREWVHVLLRLLLKYRDLVRPGRLAAELLEVAESLTALQRRIRDPRRTRFIVVTRAAELPRLETERLLGRLERLGLDVPMLVVNAMTVASGRCARCRATAAAERTELALLARDCRRRFRHCAIIQTPLVAPTPRGVAALDRWARTWAADDLKRP